MDAPRSASQGWDRGSGGSAPSRASTRIATPFDALCRSSRTSPAWTTRTTHEILPRCIRRLETRSARHAGSDQGRAQRSARRRGEPHRRAGNRPRARRDAARRHAGPRQDAEPRGHLRDDPRRASASRAVRQLLDPGDLRKPPGDRQRARPRRSGGLIGVGFDLDDETNPTVQAVRSKRRQVFADVSQNPHFASQLHGGGRIRGWFVCAHDRRRSRDRRPQRRQVRVRLLQRGPGRARDRLCRPGCYGDRERAVARDRARRSRAGRNAARGGRVARQHARA